jgi:hypothetical protein
MRPSKKLAVASLVAAAVIVGGADPLRAEEQTRALRQSFPTAGRPLRLANLAGRIELVPGTGPEVIVEATVHADGGSRGDTARLLSEMKWVRGTDKKGREEWALSYSLDRYRTFHYPRPGEPGSDARGFLGLFFDVDQTVTTYRGERVKIVSRRSSSAPTLYSQLRITLPAGSTVAVRNAVGPVQGSDLSGNLEVGTGSGDVRLGSFLGGLTVDTGSGDVTLGSVRGQSAVKTGSGSVVVRNLIGNGRIDTGSGGVLVERVAAGQLAIDTGSGDVVVKNGRVTTLDADTGSGEVRVLGVELEELAADTGSGEVTIESSLAKARRVVVQTGSGDVRIAAGPSASFDIQASAGSGELKVGYGDATLRRSGHKVVSARRGSGQTVIRVETGSGDTVISPKA